LSPDWTVDDYNAAIEELRPVYAARVGREQQEEQAAIAKLKEDIAKLIKMGAADRATAVRWIIDDETDLDFICFKRGLPYGHIKSLLS
jgi:hypothetical protein